MLYRGMYLSIVDVLSPQMNIGFGQTIALSKYHLAIGAPKCTYVHIHKYILF
jgi:hypothetical protein